MLLIDAAHESGRGRKHFVDKDEDGLLGRELDALPDDIAKLSDGQVRRDKILFLVYRSDVGLFHLFADNLAHVRNMDGEPSLPGSDQCIFAGCARPRPCVSQTCVRP